ncbi:MAG: Ribonuclease P protein component [Ignavibacteriaceae bacterium]|nr:Ribonuclease P protein component [Ignavibacteriaceae bacterium]
MKVKGKNFETLKRKTDFEFVYSKGKSLKLKSGFVRASYVFIVEGEKRVMKVATTVASSLGNSVWRNRFKRLIRESVRLEIKTISEILNKNKTNLLIVFSPHKISQKNKKKLLLNEIQSDVGIILKYITSEKSHC